MNYYYFASSLPALSLEGPLPFSFAEFRRQCRLHLRPSHFEAVCALTRTTQRSSHPFIAAWRELDTQIRNSVARFRAEKHKRDAGPYLRGNPPFSGAVHQAVDHAFSLANPLQREEALDRFRWQQLEAMAGFDMFSIHALLAYGLKLTLVERWAPLNADTGRVKAMDVIQQHPRNRNPEHAQP